jgi:membrane-bound lytic murein transglycosylase A
VPLSLFSERFKDEKALKARVVGDRIVPYFSREEIDGKGALQGKELELLWADPIDVFFLQIQGSGTVVLPNGEERHIVYADKNGHRYEPVGKFLKNKIAPYKVTMQRVEAALRSMSPHERDQMLFLNPSYVFFSLSKQRAITALGVPATPGRTIAVDPRFAPKGALAFLTFQKPSFHSSQAQGDDPGEFKEASRFVLDQDSGGAITGTGRVDLFWGRGDEAKRYAGVMQNHARILYLIPR